LNRDGLRGPRGSLWSPSTIHGNPKRGIGILHNELYIGRMVWNRQRFLKDPDTGKRVTRLNPESDWVTSNVPHLRIIDDELWTGVQARYATIQHKWTKAPEAPRFNQFRRPKYLFSGLTKCGECGAGYVVYSRDHLGCFGTRDRGTCTNRLTIARQEVEARVLRALQDKLMRKDFFEEFCREFAKEMNRLRMEQRSGLKDAKRELDRVKREIQKVIAAIKAGFALAELKVEWDALQARKEALVAQLAEADEPPPLLHPEMAGLYRQKVTALAQALEHPETRTEASEALRGLIDAIVLTPSQGELQIELKGNLAAMLGAVQNAKRSPETGDLSLQVVMVAGAGFEPATFGL
jgi:site-specific DNA recombinase